MSARSNTAMWVLGAATVAAMVVGSRRSASTALATIFVSDSVSALSSSSSTS